MTDDRGREELQLEMTLRLGVDALGDPFVQIRVDTGADAGLPPDGVEELALKLLAAAGAARARASVVRHQMLQGVPAPEAVAYADRVLN